MSNDGNVTSTTAATWDKAPLGREALIDVALGDAPADAVVVGGSMLHVTTGTISQDGIAIKGNRIAAVGDIEYTIGPETAVIDTAGKIVTPGLVSPHIHQWHSAQNGTVFAQSLLLHGTTAATDGFYGAGIVAGVRGIRFLLDEVLSTPLKLIFLVPTYSYAQMRVLGLPVSPNAVTVDEMLEMLEWPEAWGVEETGYELLLQRGAKRDRNILRVVERALELRKVVSGHGPSFPSERELNAWIAAGFTDNHEIVDADEASRQAELGLQVLLREGPALHHVAPAVRAITERRLDPRAFQLCPDLATAESLFQGQQDTAIRVAVRNGLTPIQAVQMSTIGPAEYFRLSHEMGIIAAGRFADLVILDDLPSFDIDRVVSNGEVLVDGGNLARPLPQPPYPAWLYETTKIEREFADVDFRVAAPCAEGTVTVRIIGITDDSLDSRDLAMDLRVKEGAICTDPAHGVNKVVVIDRLRGAATYGVAFVHGFGLRSGAIGSTVNFNQAVVVVGADDREIAVAVSAILKQGGAYVCVRDGHVVAELPTPLLGLASDLPHDEARQRVGELVAAWRDLGCALESPFAQLEFVCESKMPTLRVSTMGLTEVRLDANGNIDLDSFQVVPMIATSAPEVEGRQAGHEQSDYQGIVEELLRGTATSRVTLRLVLPGVDFPEVVAEALAPGVASMRGPARSDAQRAPTYDYLIRRRRLLIQNDLMATDVPAPPSLIDEYDVRAQMLGPIIVRGSLVGVISVHHNATPRAWSAEDIRSLEFAVARAERIAGAP